MNKMLPVIRVHANETPCTALVDSGCCRNIVSRDFAVRVTTISGKMSKCHGIRTVKVRTDTGNSADVEALVVYERPLNFDLLQGYDAIKALGGVLITTKENGFRDSFSLPTFLFTLQVIMRPRHLFSLTLSVKLAVCRKQKRCHCYWHCFFYATKFVCDTNLVSPETRQVS